MEYVHPDDRRNIQDVLVGVITHTLGNTIMLGGTWTLLVPKPGKKKVSVLVLAIPHAVPATSAPFPLQTNLSFPNASFRIRPAEFISVSLAVQLNVRKLDKRQ